MTLTKDAKVDFTQDFCDSCRDRYSGIYSVGEVRLDFKCHMGKWGFIAKDRGGVSGGKLRRGNIQSKGGSS